MPKLVHGSSLTTEIENPELELDTNQVHFDGQVQQIHPNPADFRTVNRTAKLHGAVAQVEAVPSES